MIKHISDDLWSVPSGGQEPNESLEECCVREVSEETGYQVKVVHHLTTKFGKWEEWDTEVHYFLVRLIGGTKRIQDPDGLIGDVGWKAREDVAELSLQYPEDYDLMMQVLD